MAKRKARKQTDPAQPKVTSGPMDLDLGVDQDLLAAVNTVHIVCRECRYSFDWSSPLLGITAEGEISNFVATVACPICGTPAKIRNNYSGLAADGRTVLTVTPGTLALFLRAIDAHVKSGEMSPAEAADILTAAPWFARVGLWLKEHNASLALAVSVLALLIAAFDSYQASTAPPTITPDQVEQIISGVIERLDKP